MERRRLLTACGSVLTGLLAGCSGGSNGGTSTSTGTATATPTATSTATPTATSTATPTPEATPDPTPTHELDESFTVGEGNNAIGYRFQAFYRADRIGSSASFAQSDGTFLIVVLTLSNPQDGTLTLPSNSIRANSEHPFQYLDDEASSKLADDERINVASLVNATILSGESKTGAIAFDVETTGTYRLEIRPPGEKEPVHVVEVGPISDVDELQSSLVG